MLKLLQPSPDPQASVAPQCQEECSQINEDPSGARRRSERFEKEVAILLIGTDAQGKSFMEETRTVLLSRHGASIISAHKLAAEQELLLVLVEQNREIPVRVVGQVEAEGSPYTYGIAFVDSQTDFWGIHFAEAPGLATSGELVECSLCGQREEAQFGDLESGVCASGSGLLKYCKRCASSTRWKLCPPDASESPVGRSTDRDRTGRAAVRQQSAPSRSGQSEFWRFDPCARTRGSCLLREHFARRSLLPDQPSLS